MHLQIKIYHISRRRNPRLIDTFKEWSLGRLGPRSQDVSLSRLRGEDEEMSWKRGMLGIKFLSVQWFIPDVQCSCHIMCNCWTGSTVVNFHSKTEGNLKITNNEQ